MLRLCTLLAIASLLGPLGIASAQALGKIKDSIQQGIGDLTGVDRYVYVDEQGREVMVHNLSSVPARFRDSVRALRADDDATAAVFSFEVERLGAAGDASTIYQYVGPAGRTVYTNIVEQVPPELRARSAMDLSHIPLHSELGSEIDRRLHEQHARLTGSSHCSDLKQAVERGRWAQLWEQYAPVVVCGGLLLAFIVVTPFFMRRVGVSAWRRTLTMAVPALALAGLSMFGMTFTNRRMGEMRAQLKPCTKQAWHESTAATETGTASPLVEHARLVQQLQQQIDATAALRQSAERGVQ